MGGWGGAGEKLFGSFSEQPDRTAGEASAGGGEGAFQSGPDGVVRPHTQRLCV